MTEDNTDVLDELAEQVAEEFEVYRHSNGFKKVSLLVEDIDPDHPTLIIHLNRRMRRS